MATTEHSSRADDQELLSKLTEFYRRYYEDDIADLAQKYPKDRTSLVVDWMDIYRYDADIADDYLSKPHQMGEYFDEALRLFELPVDVDLSGATARVTELPDSQAFSVGATRVEHRAQYVAVHGQVNKVSKAKPKLTHGAFECQRCGTVTDVPQVDGEYQEPHECQGCERQGPFRIDFKQSTFIDYQRARLQRPPEESGGGGSTTIDVTLEGDIIEECSAGDRVNVNGTLEFEQEGKDKPTFDTYLDAGMIEQQEQDFDDIDYGEYEEEIEELASRDDPIQAMVDSLAPKIKGYEDIKEGLVLQLFGASRVEYPDGQMDRGDFHLLMVGDPGCGKSSLLRAMEEIAPRSTYSSGKGASAAGMTAAAVRDDFGESEWGIEAGALVLADKGVACVDEIDKVDDDAVSSLHNSLESQKVQIDKAGINTTLSARTALTAAGNPEYGRFDSYENIAEQINLSPTLLSRFDLIFTLMDKPDPDEDREIAEHMLKMRRKANQYTHGNGEELDAIQPEVDHDVLRAYVAYAKENVNPYIPESVSEQLVQWYTSFRVENGESEDNPVPVTARKLEALERLAEARARARLSDVVSSEDAEQAAKLAMASLRDVGMDPDTKQFDADVIETGTPKSQTDRIKTVKKTISRLEQEHEIGAPLEAVIDELSDDYDASQIRHEIDQLKQKGEYYEPRTDYLRST